MFFRSQQDLWTVLPLRVHSTQGDAMIPVSFAVVLLVIGDSDGTSLCRNLNVEGVALQRTHLGNTT
jgi:hypothetical protein